MDDQNMTERHIIVEKKRRINVISKYLEETSEENFLKVVSFVEMIVDLDIRDIEKMIDYIEEVADCAIFDVDSQSRRGVMEKYGFPDSEELQNMDIFQIRAWYNKARDVEALHPEVKHRLG